MHINDLLRSAVERQASDLHLKAGTYPMMRIDGTLVVGSEERRSSARTPRPSPAR